MYRTHLDLKGGLPTGQVLGVILRWKGQFKRFLIMLLHPDELFFKARDKDAFPEDERMVLTLTTFDDHPLLFHDEINKDTVTHLGLAIDSDLLGPHGSESLKLLRDILLGDLGALFGMITIHFFHSIAP